MYFYIFVMIMMMEPLIRGQSSRSFVLLPFSSPSNCGTNQYYDISSLACKECPANSEPEEDCNYKNSFINSSV
jgi:hypothetical protein